VVVPVICHLVALALLATGPDAQALRRELDSVAGRIEQLKERRLSGESVEGELNALLVRSQELAEELERAAPAAPAVSPDADAARQRAEQLRDRANALRDEADRLLVKLAVTEARIATVLRSATAPHPAARWQEPGPSHASLTNASTAPAPPVPVLATLVEQRAKLEARVQTLEREAAELDASADALDKG
jgi:DNA repair exonuclease SbcCD ATPase subunit